MIKPFRDIQLDGKGKEGRGEKSDFAKKAEYLSQQSVNSFLNEAYNQAIDDAIGILKGYFGTDELMNHESLLPKLEALKKKP